MSISAGTPAGYSLSQSLSTCFPGTRVEHDNTLTMASMETRGGRLAWITGGGTGIGRALAQRLAAHGWVVVVSGRRPEPLTETAAQVPGRIHAWPLDVTELEAVRRAVAGIEAAHGPIALAVLNAGMYQAVKLDNFQAGIFD